MTLQSLWPLRRAGLVAALALWTPLAQAQGLDRAAFFAACETTVREKSGFEFRGERFRLNSNVVSGEGRKTIERIFDRAEALSSAFDRRQLAYVLGTAFRESRGLLVPIREAPRCADDACVIRAIDALIARKPEKYTRNYALPESNGRSYYGRGLVQITHGRTYLRVGEQIDLGSRLYDDPDLALDPEIAVKLLVDGMVHGWYSGGRHRLQTYFNDETTDWLGARRIVNPGSIDNAPITGGYAQLFYACLGGRR